jgi:hypothetical protein
MTEITIEFDDAREIMYEDLIEMFNEQTVNGMLEEQVIQQLTKIYDNREELKKQAKQQSGR